MLEGTKREKSSSKQKTKQKRANVPLQLLLLFVCFAFVSPIGSSPSNLIEDFPLIFSHSSTYKPRALGLENGLCDIIKYFHLFSVNSLWRLPVNLIYKEGNAHEIYPVS